MPELLPESRTYSRKNARENVSIGATKDARIDAR
jgi:hypothetical protein